MAKHTQGPLVANGNSIEEDKRIGARLLGSAYHDVPDMESGGVLANARLWAASPDLLAACEALLETVSAEGELSRLSTLSLLEVRELARLAVEKARPS